MESTIKKLPDYVNSVEHSCMQTNDPKNLSSNNFSNVVMYAAVQKTNHAVLKYPLIYGSICSRMEMNESL